MTTPATIDLMYRALKLASCWCTTRVWYSKADPTKCLVCVARETYEKENPHVIPIETPAEAPSADAGRTPDLQSHGKAPG